MNTRFNIRSYLVYSMLTVWIPINVSAIWIWSYYIVQFGHIFRSSKQSSFPHYFWVILSRGIFGTILKTLLLFFIICFLFISLLLSSNKNSFFISLFLKLQVYLLGLSLIITDNFVSKKDWMRYDFFLVFFSIRPPLGLPPVLGPLEQYMTLTLDSALLISSRAGADLGWTLDRY